MSSLRRTVVLVACLIALAPVRGLAPIARAHSGHEILRAERTIKLVADGQRGLAIVVTSNFGPEQMIGRVRRADVDSDGRVEPTEAAAFVRGWARELRDELPVYVDGERVIARVSRPFFAPEGAIAMRPGTLELVLEVPLEPGRHEAFVADRMATDEYDRTDVMFESTNDATLLASGPSVSPTEVVPSFAYGVSTATRRVRSIGLSFELPRRRAEGSESRYDRQVAMIAFVVFGGSILAVILGRLVRAIRRRDAGRVDVG